jgi:hypothetical protein
MQPHYWSSLRWVRPPTIAPAPQRLQMLSSRFGLKPQFRMPHKSPNPH